MADMAKNYQEKQEFWKPAIPLRQNPVQEATEHVCERCGSDFLMGSRFCHVCGKDRQAALTPESGVWEWLGFGSLRDATGQTTASLLALFLGIVCLIAAIVTGFIYTATTLLDWQAVQVWRIEWLLAALAMFVAGLLLKKK